MTEQDVESLTPQQAWHKFKNESGTLLIDVRSSMEFLFVGHPEGAIHIPWIDEPEWDINPNFVQDMRKAALASIAGNGAAEEVPILLLCRSGVRSLDAGKLLLENGFSNIYNILEGFEGDLDKDHRRGNLGGWRYHKLPWEQC
ncbi:MAG: rhodanese-like domain-containing protein [Gammaproteobacteria bacterium]|nr:rhodanese-like domain-containing protein [Gammaproteobacteria bacterium]